MTRWPALVLVGLLGSCTCRPATTAAARELPVSIDGPLSTRGLAVTRADWFAESHELKAYFSVSRALVGPVHLVVHQRDGRVVAEAVTQVDASAGVQGTLVFALPGVTDAPVASAELK